MNSSSGRAIFFSFLILLILLLIYLPKQILPSPSYPFGQGSHVKFVGVFIHVTKGWHGGVVSPTQKSFTSSQKRPVLPTGQLQDITVNAGMGTVASLVAGGIKHVPLLSQPQRVILGERVELAFFVSCVVPPSH